MAKVSAGILLYRRRDGALEVLLGHPGGPFFAQRDEDSWTIPKGLAEIGEALEDVARREFAEETGHPPPDGPPIPLGEILQRAGKVVHAWALEGDLDPARAQSNTFAMPWPPGSGRTIQVPELDRVAWFRPPEARRRLKGAQGPFLDRLLAALGEE